MSFSEKLIQFLISVFAFIFWLFIPSVALAAFDASMCNVMNVVTGTGGRAFAAVSVASVGAGFYFGKISWGMMVGTTAGIAVLFGAPSVVSAVSGDDVFECREGIQVVTCNDDGCFACPIGFTGEDCDECAVGFGGADCNECANGFVGERCDECADGFSKVDGVCQVGCDAVDINGIDVDSLDPGTKTIRCNQTNFTGTMRYSCDNGALEVLSNACVCVRNFTGDNCDQCNPGYGGENCSECAEGYTMVNKACHQDCRAEGINGVIDKDALPLSGRLTCDQDIKKFSGSINYTCIGGEFKIDSGSCMCAAGYEGEGCLECSANYVPDEDGNCVGALPCKVTVTGSTVNKTVNHGVQETATCDVSGYSGSATYTCNNGDLTVDVPCFKNCSGSITGVSGTVTADHGVSGTKACNVSGYSGDAAYSCSNGVISVTTPCYKKCTFTIDGVTDAISINHGASGNAICNASGYSGSSVSFSCNNGVPSAGTCTCAAGYGGTNCTGCVGDFVRVGDACLAKCPVSIAGVPTTLVNPGTGSVNCSQTGYNGASISYNCSNGNTITGTCSCAVGYTGSNCSSCDTANGYTLYGGVCVQKCPVSIAGVPTTLVNPGAGSVTCSQTGYNGASISYNCSGGNTITGTCSCDSVHTGATCSSCTTGRDISTGCTTCLSGYSMVGTDCRQQCAFSGVTGIADGTKVNHGSTSRTCDGGYSGTITYTCKDGTFSNMTGQCTIPECTGTGGHTIARPGGKVVHTFTSNGTLSCTASRTGVQILVVGAGGSGGAHISDVTTGTGGLRLLTIFSNISGVSLSFPVSIDK